MAHIHEKIDFTASVYIVKEGTVLLHMHKKHGIWLPPGGHIELDEDPNQAAVREAKEETGIDVALVGNPGLSMQPTDGSRDLIPPMFLNRHHFNKSHEHIDFVYFGQVIGGEVKPEYEDGVVQWFDTAELNNNELGIPDAVRSYALAAAAYFERM